MTSEETDIEPYEFIFTAFEMGDDTSNMFKKTPNGTIFRGVDRLKLISGIISAQTFAGGCHLDVYKLIKQNCMLAFFPLHDFVELRALEELWIRFAQLPWKQHVDEVKDYFGEKIGMYFLWVGHYTSWLMSTAVVGFFAYVNVAATGGFVNPIFFLVVFLFA